MLHVEASADVMPFPSGQFRFRAGPNLSTREDRLYAQSAWLWNQRFDQMEPRGAVRMPEVLERQWREEANLTQAMPTHEDDACAELMMADPPIPGWSLKHVWTCLLAWLNLHYHQLYKSTVEIVALSLYLLYSAI